MDKNAFLNQYQLTQWAESETFEWKLSTRLGKEIVQAVTAFANTRGGVLVCGIADSGEIVGQDISDATLREIAQTILANTEERLYPVIEQQILEGKSVIVVEMKESPLRPHVAYGRAYKRVGPASIAMDQGEYHRLLGTKRNGGGADRNPCPGAAMADINEEALQKFIAIANDQRNLNMPIFADPEQILLSLELSSGAGLTNGAVLLFGKKPQTFVAAAEFRVAHFADERRDVFLAQRIFEGTLFSQYEAVMDFVKERIPAIVDTSLPGNRVASRIPIGALRELVANALVHRDYYSPASSYLNIIGDEYIEIINPGSLLLPTITPATMHLPHPSTPPNRRIARAFFLAGLIEQWGEGTRRAWRLLTEAGLPAPTWESERGVVSVKVTL